jgi:hypothetical protein
MKKLPVIAGLLFVLVVIATASAATIAATSKEDAAALLYVSGYDLDPAVFYPYETGTVTVHVTNPSNTSVVVAMPDIIDTHVHISDKNAFNTKTTIGPGSTVDFSFQVTVDGTEGTYFPIFTISPVAFANSINSPLILKVDTTDVRASISAKPDTFSASKKDTVNVSVINPRDAEVTNVLIIPNVDNAEIFPAESYVGTLAAGASVNVPFAITPYESTNVTFRVSFQSGDTDHVVSTVLPITLGKNKKGAEIVVNNIEATSAGVTITLKGDVTNNGLTDAKSILVTVGDPARPANPNPVYAIGNLEPDDFSSFELTYTNPANGAVPLIVEYKDAEGYTFKETFTIPAGSSNGFSASGPTGTGIAGGASSQRRGMFGSFGSGVSQIPVTEIAIILVVIVILVYAWRKGWLRRIANRFRKERLPETDDHDSDDE